MYSILRHKERGPWSSWSNGVTAGEFTGSLDDYPILRAMPMALQTDALVRMNPNLFN